MHLVFKVQTHRLLGCGVTDTKEIGRLVLQVTKQLALNRWTHVVLLLVEIAKLRTRTQIALDFKSWLKVFVVPVAGTPQERVTRFVSEIWEPPRVTIDVAFLDLKNTGAAMKESIGTFRTIIQGPGSRSAVAA